MLCRRIEAVEDCIGNDATVVDEFLRPNGPSNLPTRRIQQLSTRVDRYSSVPIVACGGEVRVLQSVKCQERVHFIAKDEHLRAFVKNI